MAIVCGFTLVVLCYPPQHPNTPQDWTVPLMIGTRPDR